MTRSYGFGSLGEIWVHGRRKALDLGTWQAGSIVGCGVNYVKGQYFFTLDGRVVKTDEILNGVFFPCVGLHSPGQRVRINFGRFPFQFNISEMREQSRSEQLAQIDSLPAPSFSRSVYNYLLFHGYQASAEAYLASNPSELQPLAERDVKMLDSLPLRAEAMRLLKNREIGELRSLLAAHFPPDVEMPWLLELLFALDCQVFLEHVREKRLKQALEMAQKEFYEWWDDWTQERIEECCSLLAYAKPESSPAFYLLSDQHMKRLSDLLNRCLLLWTGGLNEALTYPPQPTSTVVASGSETRVVHSTPSFQLKNNAQGPQSDVDESLLEVRPDLHVLLTHLSEVQHQIRVHRAAGEVFNLETLTKESKETTTNGLKASRSPTKSTA